MKKGYIKPEVYIRNFDTGNITATSQEYKVRMDGKLSALHMQDVDQLSEEKTRYRK